MSSNISMPSTYPNCSLDMRVGRRGLSLLAMVLVIILKITLHESMGLNLPAESAPFSLGIRVRNVELKAFRMLPFFRESSTISRNSSLIVD